MAARPFALVSHDGDVAHRVVEVDSTKAALVDVKMDVDVDEEAVAGEEEVAVVVSP